MEGPLFDAAPDESGSSRAFIGAAALAVGLLTGFAAGYITGQRNGVAAVALPRPAPPQAPSAESADIPAQSYSEGPVVELETPAVTQTKPTAPPQLETPSADAQRPAAATRTGALFVLSRPSGAEVFLDEQLVGTTPLSLSDVTAGAHAVRIALPGHERWATTIDVPAGSSARVAASLEHAAATLEQ